MIRVPSRSFVDRNENEAMMANRHESGAMSSQVTYSRSICE